MLATNYRVWAWGPPVDRGVTAPNFVGIAGVAKRALPEAPRIIANELICNSLARGLMLPCPPGALLDKEGVPHFFSLNFNLAGMALPPIDPALVVSKFPRLSWGIILFDAWVMNADRHIMNIAHDLDTDRLQIFDHSHAFTRATADDIGPILASGTGQLAIGGHCLAQEISTFDGLDEWLVRLAAMPDFYIEDTLAQATKVGLPDESKEACTAFLKSRRQSLKDLVQQNLASFPKLGGRL